MVYDDRYNMAASMFMGAMPMYGVPAWQNGLAWSTPASDPAYIAVPECAGAPGDSATTRRRRRQHRARRGLAEKTVVATKPNTTDMPQADLHQPLPSASPAVPAKASQDLDATPTPLDRDDPRSLTDDVEFSNEFMQQLEAGDRTKRCIILDWLRPAALELALSVCGCRVIQKSLEVAGGTERAALVEHFRGHVLRLVESPHGNHVVQKCIEVMPPHTVQFIIAELAGFQGGWPALSQHCFGCRVVERLLEHCPEELTAPLIEAVVHNTIPLCRNGYGNYVVQHVLEYSSSEHRAQIVAALSRADIGTLAQDRMASHVLERVLELCGPHERQDILHAILASPPSLLDIACSRFGSFLVQRILRLPLGAQGDEARRQLTAGIEQLRASKHGRKTVAVLVELADPSVSGLLALS